jgi:hypothetical protein
LQEHINLFSSESMRKAQIVPNSLSEIWPLSPAFMTRARHPTEAKGISCLDENVAQPVRRAALSSELDPNAAVSWDLI